MPDPAALERRRRAAVEDAVAIDPPARRAPRVEVVGDALRPRSTATACGFTCWLSALRIGVGRDRARQVEMRDLAQRVDAGIGAAGAVHRDRASPQKRSTAVFERSAAPTARSSGAASRPGRRRHIRASACSGAWQDVPGGTESRAGKASASTARAARALQYQRPQRAFAAGDRKRVVEHGAGRGAGALGLDRRPRAALCARHARTKCRAQGLSARTRRSSCYGGQAPIEPPLLARRSCARRSRLPQAGAAARACPPPARRAPGASARAPRSASVS